MTTKNQILTDYNRRKHLFTSEMIDLFESYPENERIYAYYVAAYLADCDLRVDVNIIKDYIDHGIYLKKHFIKEDYSEALFMNYVLHPRATKEKLDYSRTFFFNQVKDLVDFENQTQTVANINHWCASHVRYEANDARTKSPLQTYKSGIGRCGESAAFLVHVLRSVGIPARQTFVPWWTHSDSNHAWIDVYVGGQWHYVGDASGEELLDRAWFSLASTRAGLVNASVFSNVPDDSQILDDHLGVWKTINTTERYTNTRKVTITSELEGLKSVQVSVFNSGSFKTMCHLKLIDNTATLDYGAGDFFIKAYWNHALILKKVDTKTHEITLSEKDIITKTYSFSQVPSTVKKLKQEPESETVLKRKQANREKSQTHYDQKMKKIKEEGLNQEATQKLYASLEKEKVDLILNNLVKKDLDDFDAEILISHYETVKEYETDYPQEIFKQYLLTPRILWEELNLYAPKFKKQFAKYYQEFRANPRLINEFVKENVDANTDHHIQNTYMAIDSILELGIASYTDQRILTVAIARSIGIAARFNQALDTIEYYQNGQFHNFELEKEYHTLALLGSLDQVDISIEKNAFRHQTNNSKIDKALISDDENQKSYRENLEAGNYEIMSSIRLPNGSIKGILEIVSLTEDKTVDIKIPHVSHEEMVEGVEVQDLIKDLDDNMPQTGLIIIGDTRTEPVSHALNETHSQAELLNALKIPVFIKPLNDSSQTDLLNKVRTTVDNCKIISDWSLDAEEALVRRVFKEPWDYPFVLLYKEGKSIISSSGYHVGTIKNAWLSDVLGNK